MPLPTLRWLSGRLSLGMIRVGRWDELAWVDGMVNGFGELALDVR